MTDADFPFAQLTYTSFEPADGTVGGWQVKQESADLSDAERARALELVTGDLAPVVPLSRFPSADEIARLPRRLRLDAPPDAPAALVHSAPAGADSSGRLGNVFTHLLFVRDLPDRLDAANPLRPLQLWRSPDWLTPYGSEQVHAASFGALPPAPGNHLTPSSVARFLVSQGRRAHGVGALLDSCARFVRGDECRVVVVADDIDHGVQWLAAALFLAAPQASLTLTFSTYERWADVRRRGTSSALSVVLRADLDNELLRHDDIILLDPEFQGPVTPAGWIPVQGKPVPPTEWSRLALAVIAAGETVLVNAFRAIDEQSHLNPDVAAHCPWWPLAMSVSEVADLSHVKPEAVAVILGGSGAGQLDSLAQTQVEELAWDAARRSSGDAKRMLQSLLAGPSPSPELVVDVYEDYLEQVVADPDTFLRQPLATHRIELTGFVGRRALALLPRAFTRVAADAGSHCASEVRSAQTSLRLFDLALSLGVQLDFTGDRQLRELVERIAEVLLEETALEVMSGVGAVHPVLLDAVAGALDVQLDRSRRPMSEALPATLLEWLSPMVEAKPPPPPVASSRVRGDTLLWACAHRSDLPPTTRVRAALALLASPYWVPGDVSPRERVRQALNEVGRREPWSCLDLIPLVKALGDRPELSFVGVACLAMFATPPSATSAELARLLRPQAECDANSPQAERDIVAVHDLAFPAAGPRALSGSAELLLAGMRLHHQLGRSMVSPSEFARVAPTALLALTELAIRHEAPALAPDKSTIDWRAINDLRPEIELVVAEYGHRALPLLVQALVSDADLADSLMRTIALVVAGSPPKGPPAVQMLRTQMAGDARGRVFADTALAAWLSLLPDPARRANDAFRSLTLTPDQRLAVSTWSSGLLPLAATATTRPIEHLEVAPWPSSS